MWGHSKKVAIYKPGREASLETTPNSALLSWIFYPLELGENKFPLS
jgi:hypothetical protein